VVLVVSIAFGVALPIAAWAIDIWQSSLFVNVLGQLGTDPERQLQVWFSGLISLLILIRHRSNISRLIRGEELSFKK
jgi:glycerol-3-phosphate acyltransferase PlsY